MTPAEQERGHRGPLGAGSRAHGSILARQGLPRPPGLSPLCPSDRRCQLRQLCPQLGSGLSRLKLLSWAASAPWTPERVTPASETHVHFLLGPLPPKSQGDVIWGPDVCWAHGTSVSPLRARRSLRSRVTASSEQPREMESGRRPRLCSLHWGTGAPRPPLCARSRSRRSSDSRGSRPGRSKDVVSRGALIPALPCPSCATVRKPFALSEPRFPHLGRRLSWAGSPVLGDPSRRSLPLL